MMEFIYDIIDLSNFLLLNYWWFILPFCTIVGIISTYLFMKIESDKKN